MKKKNRIYAAAIAALMCTGILTACGNESTNGSADGTGKAKAESVNILAWSGNGTDEQINIIKEQTGITANFTNFTMLEEMLAKLLSGGINYDIVMSGDYMINTMASQGMLTELDHDILADQFANIDPAFLDKAYDPGNKYCIPSSGGQVGIMVNRDKVTQEITSYADLWNPEFAGQIVILDDQRILMGIGNVLTGGDFNSTDEAQLEKSEAKLEELLPNIKTFLSFTQYTPMLNGECSIAVGWSHEAFQMSKQLENWEYIYPSEGMHMYNDCYVIPTTCSDTDAAYDVIKSMLSDEYYTATHAENPGGRNASLSFRETLDDYEKNSSIIFPPAEQDEKGLFLENLGEDMTKYDTLWTEFKQKASMQ